MLVSQSNEEPFFFYMWCDMPSRPSRNSLKDSTYLPLGELLEHGEAPTTRPSRKQARSIEQCKKWVACIDHSNFPSHWSVGKRGSRTKLQLQMQLFLSAASGSPLKLWIVSQRGLEVVSFLLIPNLETLQFVSPTRQKRGRSVVKPNSFRATTAEWANLAKNIWRNSKEHDKVIKNSRSSRDYNSCNCKVTCGDLCLNRILQIECDSTICKLSETRNCGNTQFTTLELGRSLLFREGTRVCRIDDKKGYGLVAIREFAPYELICEYTGEVINQDVVKERLSKKKFFHYYHLSLEQGLSIDSTVKGSVARFVNHSCAPNAEVQKWYVQDEPRIGLFAGSKGIIPGEEITYDYNFIWLENAEPQLCYCQSANCRGVIGKKHSPSPVSQPTKSSKNTSQEGSQPNRKRPHKTKDNLLLKTEKDTDARRLRRSIRHKGLASDVGNTIQRLPLHVRKQLSIDMAPPGKADDITRQLLAVLLPTEGRTRSSRQRKVVEACMKTGIPLKYTGLDIKEPFPKKRVNRRNSARKSRSSSQSPSASETSASEALILKEEPKNHSERGRVSEKLKIAHIIHSSEAESLSSIPFHPINQTN
ncbi:BA75_01441T0 [Komagataella pastoris]|uniref:BA75_01441T0 n=1 Tax=Komagataella pastoris TaxID=4922 RepID=A0A1B2J6Y3_PICPA|nr:BA75_01441T0 [Komagataella pastoris]